MGDGKFGLFTAVKRAWMNYLRRLEKSNKELFTNGHASCCDLNKSELNRKV